MPSKAPAARRGKSPARKKTAPSPGIHSSNSPVADDVPLLFRTRRKLQRSQLKDFLELLTKRITRGRFITCLITGDAELQRLNQQFRGKDAATDVLSFPASSSGSSNGAPGARTAALRFLDSTAGDVAISIDRASAQASEHEHSVEDELRILMLHGALHLSGLDHETDSGEMARAEARWRKRLGLPSGLIERTHENSQNGAGTLRQKTPVSKAQTTGSRT